MIYFDNAATTPMSETSLDAYSQAARKYYGNSNSLHDRGSEAENALSGARSLLARLLGVPAKGLLFTGSGSEANFLAIVSLALAHEKRGRHIVTTTMEHSSVRNTMNWLKGEGFEISVAPADPKGLVTPEALEKVLREDTILVSIQHVNSEIGTVQDLKSLGKVLKPREILFHSDLVQGFGKIPVDLEACGLSGVSLSGHKVHGPKGIGAAWIDNRVSWRPFIPGSTQERGFRPGTVDVPAAIAFAVAANERFASREEDRKNVQELWNRVRDLVRESFGGLVTIEGSEEHQSPYIMGMTLSMMEGQHAMLESNRGGLAISTGSACQVNEQNPSATMLAIGKSSEEAQRLIRFSFSHRNTLEEAERSAEILGSIFDRHRASTGAGGRTG
ncbi:MAG: IscS subfamily cysteine desulfurase [Balneolaceae bacterium]